MLDKLCSGAENEWLEVICNVQAEVSVGIFFEARGALIIKGVMALIVGSELIRIVAVQHLDGLVGKVFHLSMDKNVHQLSD